MPNLFSFPAFASTGSWSVTGYNLYKSTASGNTTSQTAVAGAGTATITPASMNGISVGHTLQCDTPGTAAYEEVPVTTVTSSTFTATFANAHTTGFLIQDKSSAPQYYGPWVPVSGYQNFLSNMDVFDPNGAYWDLYMVQPIIKLSNNTVTVGPMSRPFYSWQPLYDTQISALLEHFRQSFLSDPGQPQVDSTVLTESTGTGTFPFITDDNTSRFFPAFLPGADPIKFVSEEVRVFQGSDRTTAAPLAPYYDFFPSGDQGYIDFKTNPALNSYLRVEYRQVRFTNDQCRNMLLNAVSALSHYGINSYAVNVSNNLYYLASPLPNRDLAELVCDIASLNLLQATTLAAVESSESWKDGKVEYTSDPSRGIQAATLFASQKKELIRQKANNWILATRSYLTRGEYDSFFDTTGVLPVYTLFISNFNMFGYWL